MVRVFSLRSKERLSPEMLFGWIAWGDGDLGSVASGVEELLLQVGERANQFCRVECFVQGRELTPGSGAHGRMSEDSLIRSHGWIVATGDFAAGADFFAQFHTGLEEVGIQPQELIEPLEEFELQGPVVAVIAHGGAD